MNMKYVFVASVIALTMGFGTADAEIAAKKVPAVSVPTFVPSVSRFSWSGYYVGLLGNGIWGTSEMGFPSDIDPNSVQEQYQQPAIALKEALDAISKPSAIGFSGGAFTGYNIDLSQDYVLGFETDFQITKTKPSVSSDITDEKLKALFLRELNVSEEQIKNSKVKFFSALDQKWEYATRLRIGKSFDKFLPYVAGGVSATGLNVRLGIDVDYSANGLDGTEGADFEYSGTAIGYTLGAGLDYALKKNLFMRAEYRYTNFEIGVSTNTQSKNFNSRLGATLAYATHAAQFGLGFKF
ncbi:outer membrane protein [Bartonella sp. DGB2]|uniref:outer membrane protein n=1 Tax=Bartonella sp. DGB2 TaxID=3388426 RepID=UPI0039901966